MHVRKHTTGEYLVEKFDMTSQDKDKTDVDHMHAANRKRASSVFFFAIGILLTNIWNWKHITYTKKLRHFFEQKIFFVMK
jgi:hypothetical protein